MKRILILTALAATLAVAAVASPAGAGLTLTPLTVSPNQGRPGDAFTVSGGGCVPPAQTEGQAAAQSGGGRFAPRRGNTFQASASVAFPVAQVSPAQPDTNGNWSVAFVVPPGTPPGVYEVAASCFPSQTTSVGRARAGVSIPYESSTYTVLGDPATPGAPPAAPVPGTPTFTG